VEWIYVFSFELKDKSTFYRDFLIEFDFYVLFFDFIEEFF